MSKPISKVIVVGGGSAGFLSAITLKRILPDLEVVVIRSPEFKIIGVGEGTTLVMPKHLHQYLDIDVGDFYANVNPMWKLGIKFLWGPRDYFNYTFGTQFDSLYQKLSKGTGYYCKNDVEYADIVSALMTECRAFERQQNGAPLLSYNLAYHLENGTFVEYCEKLAALCGVQIVDDTITKADKNAWGITKLHLKSGEAVEADLYVDCSGFRSELLGKTMEVPFRSFDNTLFCDRAVLGSWERSPDEPIKPYTTAETMDSGWAWQIEHEHKINRGYVYSSAFISDEDAEHEFRQKNPRLGETRMLKFATGCYEKNWVQNVVAIGNSAGFVEPLEATSLTVICNDAQAVAETIKDCQRQVTPTSVRYYNKKTAKNWEAIRCFLAVHYRYNTRLQTPFWKECCEKVDLGWAEELVEYYQENGPSVLYRDFMITKPDEFDIDGYLTMLVGQAVPYQDKWQPSSDEQQTWGKIQAMFKAKAQQAYTVEQSLQLIRDPRWRWSQDFYRNWK